MIHHPTVHTAETKMVGLYLTEWIMAAHEVLGMILSEAERRLEITNLKKRLNKLLL